MTKYTIERVWSDNREDFLKTMFKMIFDYHTSEDTYNDKRPTISEFCKRYNEKLANALKESKIEGIEREYLWGQFALKEGADKVIYMWLIEPFNWFLNN